MKRLFTLCAIVVAVVVSSCSKFDDTDIWDKLNDHESRITALEELCKQMNTNITALQTIVEALEKNDYITNVSPVRKDGEVIGYTITFAHSDTITIYNGEDGTDGYVPNIGVMKDVDGIYYWTIDGEWLLDGKGDKIQANGIDGGDGIDGITPRLKIENDYWYVSYDEGTTWFELGKASGNDGVNGIDGDSIFSSVTQDDEYVYFNLADGTMITLPKHDKENILFEDLRVKMICCKNWDTNYDGELSYTEASAVSDIGSIFTENTDIMTFTEFEFFIGVTELSTRAFEGCTSLWKITLPSSLLIIDEYAFSDCSSLHSICINSHVQSIGASVFENCISLKNIKIYNGVSTLGNSVFRNCKSLEEVVLPNSITSIGDNTFDNCTNLKNVVISNNITRISYGLFNHCTSLSEVIIPKSVTKIYECAFDGCTSLKSITIPKYVYDIGVNAFYGCSSLQTIYCTPTTPPILSFYRYGYDAEEYCSLPKNTGMIIYVPRESYTLYTQYSSNPGTNTSGWISGSKMDYWYFYKSYVAPYDF